MEMHQVRYFLAVSRTLNFTRAAQDCGVSQPSLTRAIQLLEGEFGGELFQRERGLTHLTNLGERMLPLVQQCYDSAMTAKTLANSLKSGAVAPLKIALSSSVNIGILLKQLAELSRAFAGLELKFERGGVIETVDHLKKGGADIGIAGPLKEQWERLDHWPLFTEPFVVALNENHHLANRRSVDIQEISGERFIKRVHCELLEYFEELFAERGIVNIQCHEACSEADVVGLLAANVGIALVPASTALPENIRRLAIEDARFHRPVGLYCVAGRQRSPAASTLVKMLRSSDWSAYRA